MALSVHTNQQYIKYSKTNIQRNRIWVRIPRVTRNILGQTRLQLLISCSSVLFSQNLPKKKKKLRESSFFFFPSFFFSHSFVPSPFFFQNPYFFVFVSTSQKLNLLKEFHFHFFYFPSFLKIRMFLLSMWDLLFPYVCNHINPLFPPKIFFLPSLSARA